MAANLPKPSLDENISTILSAGITDVATSMDVSDASKIVAPCYLVIDRVDSAGTAKATSLWEYVKVTNVATNTLTITRAQGGSTGQAHGSGAVVEAVVTSSMFEDWYNVLNPEHTSTGGHVISTATITNIYLSSLLSASGASIAGFYPSGASGAILTSRGNSEMPIYATPVISDGWTTSSDTWTYASASTFTIAGVDRTTTFTKGTRLKFTQTTAKYAVVVASSFSTDTTVTIAVNTDYTIANAAITSPYYSYQANPQGYPGWFAYTPTWTGFSADPAYSASPRFNIIGTTCFTRGVASANGTSNSANMYMTLPAASGQTTSIQNAGRAVDNGAILTSPAMINFTAASNSGVWATQAGGGFTTSGAKSVNWTFEYEI